MFGFGCASAPVDSPARAEARQQLASGRSAFEQRRWTTASQAFGRAALIFAALDENSAETAALRDQGESLRRAGDPQAARAVQERALELDRQLGDRQGQAQDLAGLARSQAAQQEVEPSIRTAQDALALAQVGTPLEAVLQNDLALYLLARGDSADPAHALELLTSASASNQARNNALAVASNELNLGRAELASGDSQLAESHLLRALERFQALQDPEGLAQTHETLAQLYLAQRDFEQARFHRDRARSGFEFLEDRGGLRRVENLVVQ
jgi:tetratricopeptide (TPR) repeat protein